MIVAVFDSGVDFTHAAFGGTSAPFAEVTGYERPELAELFRKAVVGELPATELEHFVNRAPMHAQPSGSGVILPGRDFAGHYPTFDLAERGESTTNVYDYNGHGTASASLLTRAGHTVLPIKVGYSLAPYISLGGLVAGCEWLLDQRIASLDCDVALWPFGLTVDEAVEAVFFAQLANEMRQHGVAIFASGRGVYQNNAAPDQRQIPSDVAAVIAVDEQVVLHRHVLALGTSEEQTCYHLPATPRPPRLDRQLARVVVCTDAVADGWSGARAGDGPIVALCTAKDLRACMPYLNAFANVVIVTEADMPYVHSPLPYLFDVAVLVTTESIPYGLAGPRHVTLTPAGIFTALATTASRGARLIGTSGMAVPAAGTGSRWMAAFGASVAGPSALASCV